MSNPKFDAVFMMSALHGTGMETTEGYSVSSVDDMDGHSTQTWITCGRIKRHTLYQLCFTKFIYICELSPHDRRADNYP